MAWHFAVEVDIIRFSPKGSLFRLNPYIRWSGHCQEMKTPTSQMDNPALLQILYMPTQNAKRFSSPVNFCST